MASAQVNGITIEYETHGDESAPPLLLVMGLGGQLIGWPLEFVERLAAAGPFRVIRFDNRDIGRSTKIAAPAPTRRQILKGLISRKWAKAAYSLSDMAKDAVGLLDHLGIDRAHVVGASMGGMIAQTMAIEHPTRVRSLTSIMSNTGDRRHGSVGRKVIRHATTVFRRDQNEDPVERGVQLFRIISGPQFDENEAREMVKEALARDSDLDGVYRQMMAIEAAPDRTADLARVNVPTLVIHGIVDPLVKPSGGMATAKAIPGARLVMYPDMGHDLPRARWDQVIGEITETARQADARP